MRVALPGAELLAGLASPCLTSGTPGKRQALPHSRILMHQGSAGMGGSTTDVELQAEDVRHTRDTVLGITSEDTGQPLERVFEDSLHDHWYSADEAKEYGFIGSGVANSVIAQLLFLESSSPDADINFYINCQGGDPSAMLAIYDTMSYIRPRICTTYVGQAVGVGAILLGSGTAGHRLALLHTRIVLHQPSNQERRANIPDLILQADEAVRIRAELEQILSRHTGQSAEKLHRDTDHDRVFTPVEAREYGLIDHVISVREGWPRRLNSSPIMWRHRISSIASYGAAILSLLWAENRYLQPKFRINVKSAKLQQFIGPTARFGKPYPSGDLGPCSLL
ncbi:ClpP family protease [Ancrocorticia populi]|uniref:ClpP family protease n=1 Tax=Ancrocorticia populi TaxID=2175228 RepID=UPI003F98D3C9